MNKIFTLLAAAGLAMSANATVLWEGEVVMGSWNGMLSLDCESTNWTTAVADAMGDLAEGDKLVFTYKDVSTDEEAPGQIQIDAKVGPSWEWTAMVEYDPIPADGVYTYTITDAPIATSDYTELETLPTRGFFVKGQNATLTKVELVKAGGGDTPATGTAIWTGSVVLGNWTGMLEYKNEDSNTQWNNAVMSGLEVGDKIVFHCEDVTSGAQIQLNAIGLDANWSWATLVEYDNISGSKYTYKITGDIYGDYTDLEMLSQRGFAVKGQKATIVKIEVISNGGGQGGGDTPEPPVTGGEALWEGEVVMGSWKGMLSLDCESTTWTDKVATAMAGLAEGDKLVFTYKDVSTDEEAPAQIQIDAKVGPDWTWTPIVEYDPIPANGVYTFEITDSPIADTDYTELETLPTRGFFVKGQGATLIKVALVKNGSGSSVENIAADAIDFNAPVEIYTIDGRRVNEMTQGRIYIVRQGAKVTKIAK